MIRRKMRKIFNRLREAEKVFRRKLTFAEWGNLLLYGLQIIHASILGYDLHGAGGGGTRARIFLFYVFPPL